MKGSEASAELENEVGNGNGAVEMGEKGRRERMARGARVTLLEPFGIRVLKDWGIQIRGAGWVLCNLGLGFAALRGEPRKKNKRDGF